MSNHTSFCAKVPRFLAVLVCVLWVIFPLRSEAATLRVTPATGVYTTNSTFSVTVSVNSQGAAINAAEGTLRFDPNQLAVVSVSRASSIFSLWVTEPTFSNSAGTISFSGGSPAGYTGSAGTVMSITFRAKTAGTARLTFGDGAVLANDGRGTNVLSSMSSATFTIGAENRTPVPEVIEYVPPANTPGAPKVTSKTHPNPQAWYRERTAVLAWTLPPGITAVRTLLNDRSSAVPTRVYDDPITTITLEDLPEGVSYFHIQFQNEDGWGAVTHYRLAVDTERPADFSIDLPENSDPGNPEQTLVTTATDTVSGIDRYMIKLNTSDAFEYRDEDRDGRLQLPPLEPGYHAVIIEAKDAAGNGSVSSFSFTIEAFSPPQFVDVPVELTEGIIPVLRGTTRPSSSVTVTLRKLGDEPTTFSVASDETGLFQFIPTGALSTGVYEVTAQATDARGAQSEVSSPVRIAVQQPGFIRIGAAVVNVLSVILSLVALSVLTMVSFWYLYVYLRRFRRQVKVESREALAILRREFATLHSTLGREESGLLEARKGGKLTKAEATMISTLRAELQAAEARVEKEISDVSHLADGSSPLPHKQHQ